MAKRFSVVILIIPLMVCICQKNESWRYSKEQFKLGPVVPKTDLRNMLRSYIVKRSCAELEASAEKRINAFRTGQWEAWRDTVRKRVAAQMGELPVGKNGCGLNIRSVSHLNFPHCDIENVLIESLKGWDVNASVFLPKKDKYPPPWRAIVVPVGHSSKTRKNYQIPAQVFASLGYAAVIFDPPGMAGEKQGGNDHFIDGVRCYLTGYSSNRYFIMDALRCIDYLETRSDIDMSNGIGMTGVSGGGTTTMFATLLDDRINAAGPACCALPAAYHPVLDAYAPCVESMAPDRYADGLDNVDLLCAATTTPLLFMFGEKDEVFKAEWSYVIADDIRQAYQQSGHTDKYHFYADPGGHAYTVEMALRFTAWMDKWIAKEPARNLDNLTADDFQALEPEQLFCYPRLDGNMYSLNKAIAQRLKLQRDKNPSVVDIKQVLNIKEPVKAPAVQRNELTQIWVHYLEEISLYPEQGIELPATFMYPVDDSVKAGAILFFDDRGRWKELRKQGYLAEACDFLKRGQVVSSVLTVDLRGWGDTTPTDMPYDVASWADRERWISYVSAAMGDHVLAMRIRDALAAFAYLKNCPEIDPSKIIVGGYGLGAVVAIHVAALSPGVAGLLTVNALGSFESLATSEIYLWSLEAFLPFVLQQYDLPELMNTVDCPILMINVRGALKEVLDKDDVKDLYKVAIRHNEQLEVVTTDDVTNTFIDFAKSITLSINIP
jgi:dienelactone hydrolase